MASSWQFDVRLNVKRFRDTRWSDVRPLQSMYDAVDRTGGHAVLSGQSRNRAAFGSVLLTNQPDLSLGESTSTRSLSPCQPFWIGARVVGVAARFVRPAAASSASGVAVKIIFSSRHVLKVPNLVVERVEVDVIDVRSFGRHRSNESRRNEFMGKVASLNAIHGQLDSVIASPIYLSNQYPTNLSRCCACFPTNPSHVRDRVDALIANYRQPRLIGHTPSIHNDTTIERAVYSGVNRA